MSKISSLQQLKNVIAQASANQLIIIDFGASWCGPCKQIAPIFQNLSKTFSQHLFLKVNIDESEGTEEIGEYYNIRSVPTFYFIKNGKVLETFAGADNIKLLQIIKKYT